LDGRRIRDVGAVCCRPLQLRDIKIYVKNEKGDVSQEDATCDSTFMLGIIRTVGRRIRKCFHWVPDHVPVHLFMDNAGGHGTNEAKQAYVGILSEEFNVQVIWQVPRSPETNMLDLGVWAMLQAIVESKYCSEVEDCIEVDTQGKRKERSCGGMQG
jgi:hypothetical protein